MRLLWQLLVAHLTFAYAIGSIAALMRTIFLAVIISAFSVFQARAELINGIYVIVNDAVITYHDVESAITPLAQLLVSQYRNQPEVLEQKIQATRSEKIEELVERQLILNEFKTGGYQLPESIIDDVIRERIKERFGDRATLTKTLQAEGMTYETYRQQVKDDYIVRAMVQTKISPEKILVSPHKIEAFYNEHQSDFKVTDQVKLRMIALNKAKDNPGAARKLADEIFAKLKEGASFADMASVYSDTQRDKGGDRGWVERSVLRSELSQVAFSLKKGQFSDVIDLPEACYLLFVEDSQGAHVKPLADVREDIEKTLRGQEQARLKNKWIERLKSKAFVRYF